MFMYWQQIYNPAIVYVLFFLESESEDEQKNGE